MHTRGQFFHYGRDENRNVFLGYFTKVSQQLDTNRNLRISDKTQGMSESITTNMCFVPVAHKLPPFCVQNYTECFGLKSVDG